MAQAQTDKKTIKLSNFSLTDSTNVDEVIYGTEIYKGLLSDIKIDKHNDNTIIAKGVVSENKISKQGQVSKVYIYDEDGDVFAYGLIPQFSYITDSGVSIELDFYLSFSDATTINLNVPTQSYIDIATFQEHDHDEKYYKKPEVDNLLTLKSDSDHNHNDKYYVQDTIDTKLKTLSDTIAKVINALEPVGHIGMFYSTVAPNNYLIIDGKFWSKVTYSDLWEALQNQPNVIQNTIKTHFKIVDARGLFPRFLDHGAGVDSGRVLGSAQGDAIRDITASVELAHMYALQATGAFTLSSTGNANWVGTVPGIRYRLRFQASKVVPTADENRPKNISYLACIKYQSY